MKVVSKQNNSHMCLICGMNNSAGVRGQFYNMEDGSVGGLFTFREEHQSYPGRVHGGMLATMIDELAGRVLWVDCPDKIAVTMDINVKYRKPVPYNTPLKGRGMYTERLSRAYSAKCYIMDMDNNILAEGIAKYLILPVEKVCDASLDEELDIYVKDDVTEIDFGENR
ncbi:PaaI family thioesterase [Anaerocaecibacter muris]|uniref:PaaI family thioesterase n=1 Tax=Anaerocaecibacter muris TaxID=2941513 RepID=UPI00203DDE87|nr:PaaI family thioesterase [Anaerocaecibacter muris]